jgi:hypothetical protein
MTEKPTQWRDVRGIYQVSPCGYVRRIDTGHLMTPRMRCASSFFYDLRLEVAAERAVRVAIKKLVLEAWEIDLELSVIDYKMMRNNLLRWGFGGYADKVGPSTSGLSTGKYKDIDPFAALDFGERPWCDPIMDPLTNREEPAVWVNIRDIKECAA